MDLGEISKVVKDEYQKRTKQNKYLKEYTLKKPTATTTTTTTNR